MSQSYRFELRRLVTLATPLVISQLAAMTLWVIDVLMLGAVSVEALDAASLGRVWVMGTVIVAMGVLLGLDPIASQAYGGSNRNALARVRQRGLVLAWALAPLVAGLWLVTAPVLELLGQEDHLSAEAGRYVLAQLPGALFFLLYVVYRHWLQAQGIMRPVMWVSLSANGVNAFANWILIFGNLGAPALGSAGAGAATAITLCYMAVSLGAVARLAQRREADRPRWDREVFAWAHLKRIVVLGAPVGAQMSLEYWAFSISTLWAGWLGVEALGAHTIAITLASLTFMVPLGISFATVTRVGNLLGAGDPQGAQRASWVALGLGAGVMTVGLVAFLIGREALPDLFTDDVGVIALAATILPAAASFQLFDGVQAVGAAVLRGMGRTLPAALFALLGFYALALPAAWWLAFERGLGVAGIWWGMALGLFAVSVMLVVYIAKRGPAHGAIP